MNGQLLVTILARLVLAITFAAAGWLKYRDRGSFIKGVIEFGTPARLARPLGWVLPGLEIATAIVLLIGDPYHAGSFSAAILLGLFTFVVAVSLFRGLRPKCRCFGQMSSKPIGWTTVARNLLLLALAGVCLRPEMALWPVSGRTMPLPFGTLLVAGALATITAAVVAEGWIIILLLRQQGKLLTRVEQLESGKLESGEKVRSRGATDMPPSVPGRGLAVGSPAPNFQLPALSGEILSPESFLTRGLPILAVFTNPHCDACNKMLPNILSWQAELGQALTVVLISEGKPDDNRAKFTGFGLDRVLLQKRREAAIDFQVEFTPSALIIRADGKIGSPVYSGAEGIGWLVRQAAEGAQLSAASSPARVKTFAIKAGEPAPVPRLRDLDGNSIDLSVTQTDTLVIFWNPRCGFCAKMLPEIQAWENSQEKRPELLLVASGSALENRNLGLRSPIVLDQSSALMQTLRVPGTPSGFLVAAGGKVDSSLMVGSDAIWNLAAAFSR